MKKTIKILIVLIGLMMSFFILFDGVIARHFLIKNIQLISNKKVFLKKVDIQYFPNFEITLFDFMFPNPINDNYLLNSKKIVFGISISALLHRSVIIENLEFQDTLLFDTSSKTIVINYPKQSDKKKVNYKELTKKAIKKIIESYNLNNVKLSGLEQFDISEQSVMIEEIIAKSGKDIKQKKESILEESNLILYNINKINIKSLSSVDQIMEVNKKINAISDQIKGVEKNIAEIETLYTESESSIAAVNNEISRKFDQPVNFEIDNLNQTNTVTAVVQTLTKRLVEGYKGSKKVEKKDRFNGKTYTFNDKKYPKFLIKNLKINQPGRQLYATGTNLTIDRYVESPFFLQVDAKDTPYFKRFKMRLNGEKGIQHVDVDASVNRIFLGQQKLYDNDEFLIYFSEKNNVAIDIHGQVSDSSNIQSNIQLIKPKYRIINKSRASQNLIKDLFMLLENKDLLFTVDAKGNINDLDVSVKSNMQDLMASITDTLMADKINEIVKQKRKKIDQLKLSETEKVTNKTSAFHNDYQNDMSQINFQLNEVLSQKDVAQNKLNKKKSKLESKVIKKVEGTLKKLKF